MLEVKRQAGLSADLRDLVIALSALDSGRSFSLPNMGVSTNTHPLIQVKTYLEFNPHFPEFYRCYSPYETASFSPMPTLWRQPRSLLKGKQTPDDHLFLSLLNTLFDNG